MLTERCVGVEHGNEVDGLARRAQATRHVERHHPAERVPAEAIRTARLDRLHDVDVAARDRLDRAVGQRALLQPVSLDRVHVMTVDRFGERPQTDRRSTAAGNEEDGRPARVDTERDDEI